MEHKITKDTYFFTADIDAFYTNINTTAGIARVRRCLERNHPLLDIDLIIKGLTIVMENNIFDFGDTTWKQTKGSAMGVDPGPPYSTIYFGDHEETEYTQEKYPRLIADDRLIDDKICLWNHNTTISNDPDGDLQRYKDSLYIDDLTFTFSKLSKRIDFLDITLIIDDDGKLQWEMYEKPLNEHLYIPKLSAHPPSCLKGLIFGQFYRFHTLNSNTITGNNKINDFYHHLRDRGYTRQDLLPLFQTALGKINGTTTASSSR